MEVLTPDNLEAFAKLALEAATSKNWALLLSLALVAVVWGLRKVGKPTFIKTDAGGAVSVLLMSGLGAVVTALVAGQPFTWPLVLSALQVGFTAAGGYSVLKKLLWPLLVKWLKLEKKPEAAVVEEAKAAGDKAVKLVEKSKFEDLGK